MTDRSSSPACPHGAAAVRLARRIAIAIGRVGVLAGGEDSEYTGQPVTVDGRVVTANGGGDVISVKIDPMVVDPEDVEMLEDLVLAAVSEAQSRATAGSEEEMKKGSGGLSLPFQLPGL